jgi:hypothetical protein
MPALHPTLRNYRNSPATVEIKPLLAGFRITGADGHWRKAE